MKKYNGVPAWIIFTLIFISLGLSAWALIISNVDFCGLVFDDDKVITFAGLLFTVIGAVFAFYFVIIGIDANRKKDELSKLDKEIEVKKSQMEFVRRVESDQQDTLYGHLIDQAKTINDDDERDRVIKSLRLSRARLATQSFFLSKEKRLQRLPDLGELGDNSDIIDLNRIINDPFEDREIIESAKVIKMEIEKRI